MAVWDIWDVSSATAGLHPTARAKHIRDASSDRTETAVAVAAAAAIAASASIVWT
jgi:hypothetical protein